MSGVVRSVGSIAAFAVGTALGGPVGGAIGSTLFGLLVPAGTPSLLATGPGDTLKMGAEPGTVIPEIFGLYPVKGNFIDCGFDSSGEAAGIESTVKSKKKGGFLGIGGTKVKTRTDYLKAAFSLGVGPLYCEQIKFDYGEGEVVEYDRYNDEDDEMPNPETDPEGWRAFLVSQFDGSATYRPGKGVQFTPQYAPDGTLIAELSETLRLYAGTEWQDPDTALSQIHGDRVCAYVGQAYAMWNRWVLQGSGLDITYVMRNFLDDSRGIVRQRFAACGVPRERIKLTSLSGRIEGCAIAQVEGVRELIEKIAALQFHDLLFLDGGFQDASRINPATFVLDASQLGARLIGEGGSAADEAQSAVAWSQKGARELVTILRLKFLNLDNNYEEDEVVAQRQVAGHENELSLDFPFASTPVVMTRLVDVMMDELWAANSTESITLLQRQGQIAPGCVLIYDAGDGLGTRQVRLTKQPNAGLGGLLECEGVLYDAGVYGRHRIVDPAPKPRATVVSYPVPDVVLLDLPALAGETQSAATLLLGAASPGNLPFSGAFFESQVLGEETASPAAAIGTLVSDWSFTSAQSTTFHPELSLRVRFEGVSPQTAEIGDVAGGANLLAIQTPLGALLVSFVQSAPVAGQARTFDLSNLWPGRFGTEIFSAVAAGTKCILLTDAQGEALAGLESIATPLAQIGRAAGYEVSALPDPTKTTGPQSVTPQGRSLRPAEVGQFRAVSTGSGVALEWAPRTRDWESAAAYWQTGQAPRETDPRRFLVRLVNGATEVSRRILNFATDADLPLHLDLSAADIAGATGGQIWQEGAYLRGDIRSFSL